jgi:hypothetical protein
MTPLEPTGMGKPACVILLAGTRGPQQRAGRKLVPPKNEFINCHQSRLQKISRMEAGCPHPVWICQASSDGLGAGRLHPLVVSTELARAAPPFFLHQDNPASHHPSGHYSMF